MVANKYNMAYIDAMDGHDFEHFIAALLRKLGYQNVAVTRGSGDQGVDVLAEKEGVRYAVQCKCYSSDLGNTPVQEVNTGKAIYHCHVGAVVTNRYFTQSAKEAAKATGVLLWDRAKLQELITQAEFMEQSVSNEDALLKRGFMALEDGEWHKADIFFEHVLNLNAECGEAYLGKVLAATQTASLEELRGKMVQLDTFKDFSRAMQFSSGTQLQALQAVKELLQKKWQAKEEAERRRREEEARIAEEQRIAQIAREEAEHRCKEEAARVAKEQKEAWVARVSPFWKPLREHSLIAVGGNTVGLKTDGTVITTGPDYELDWRNIVAVAAGSIYTVGLKSDGTVVTAGAPGIYAYGQYGQCNVSDWKDIVAVAAGSIHTVGLKADGTVVAVGKNSSGQCRISEWKDIVAIAAGNSHTVGLKSNGTVVITGTARHVCVAEWRDIVAVAAGSTYTVGLKSDGTVVTAGAPGIYAYGQYGQYNVSDWKDIVAVAAGSTHTVGLKADGTVVAVGFNGVNQCNVSDWKLFNSIETLEREREEAKERKYQEEKCQR